MGSRGKEGERVATRWGLRGSRGRGERGARGLEFAAARDYMSRD